MTRSTSIMRAEPENQRQNQHRYRYTTHSGVKLTLLQLNDFYRLVVQKGISIDSLGINILRQCKIFSALQVTTNLWVKSMIYLMASKMTHGILQRLRWSKKQ